MCKLRIVAMSHKIYPGKQWKPCVCGHQYEYFCIIIMTSTTEALVLANCISLIQ